MRSQLAQLADQLARDAVLAVPLGHALRRRLLGEEALECFLNGGDDAMSNEHRRKMRSANDLAARFGLHLFASHWESEASEQGEQLLDQGARAFCELLEEVDNFDVNRLAKGPLG